ncbi:MAG TPA: glutamate 5-kinase [Bacillota bacterium]|nr:glutamate 5-kinase [Bacillota bacterium]
METFLNQIGQINRIVVKVGTTTLTHANGKLNLNRLEQLIRQLVDLQNQGKEVVIVTSGAVGAGMGRLGLTEKPASILERQALAAIGQGLLMQIYEKLFAEYGITVAQVLLTRSDVGDRKRYLNARNTLLTLLKYRAIPIINENDTIATEELKIGENDTLSALVTGLIDAELLILLSDIDGLYTKDPKKDATAELIPFVTEITSEIKEMAGGSASNLGTGGMVTKIGAAQMALAAGSSMVIMNGDDPSQIQKLFAGKPVGTIFVSKHPAVNHRKRWIAYGPKPHGVLTVDSGAERALLEQGKSLLPSGVVAVAGEFEEGDLIKVVNQHNMELARGLTNYAQEQLVMIKGHKTGEIETILGFKSSDEVIHRDNLVITG